MRPLTDLAERGVTFSRIPADRDGVTNPRDLLPLIRPETRLVLVSHASNVSGTLFPLEEAAELCRARGLPLAVDGAQTAGHFPIDFDALHLAALCVPGHKGLLGPQGIGAVLLHPEFARQLSPIVTGGTGSASDSERQPPYLPDKFESGTQNLPGIFGLHAALKYVESRGVDALRRREAALTGALLDALRDLPLRAVGPKDPARRVGVVSLDFAGQDNAAAAFRLESEFGILTRCGLHCAPNAHKTLETFPQGTVRLSVGHAFPSKLSLTQGEQMLTERLNPLLGVGDPYGQIAGALQKYVLCVDPLLQQIVQAPLLLGKGGQGCTGLGNAPLRVLDGGGTVRLLLLCADAVALEPVAQAVQQRVLHHVKPAADGAALGCGTHYHDSLINHILLRIGKRRTVAGLVLLAAAALLLALERLSAVLPALRSACLSVGIRGRGQRQSAGRQRKCNDP